MAERRWFGAETRDDKLKHWKKEQELRMIVTEAARAEGVELSPGETVRYVDPATTAKYLPDFAIEKKDGGTMFIETKGRFLSRDRAKMLLVKKQHPELDIRFVFSNAQGRIGKKSQTTFAMWCERNGFPWADKGVVPSEWIAEMARHK